MIPNISKITDFLYVSARPEESHREELLALNIQLIISMNLQIPGPSFRKAPFRLLWLPSFDSPYIRIPLANLRRGAQAALEAINQGEIVLSHCKQGVHRGVAMACCVLIATGMTADDAMRLVCERRDVADPYAPHIQSRIQAFEQDWQARLVKT